MVKYYPFIPVFFFPLRASQAHNPATKILTTPPIKPKYGCRQRNSVWKSEKSLWQNWLAKLAEEKIHNTHHIVKHINNTVKNNIKTLFIFLAQLKNTWASNTSSRLLASSSCIINYIASKRLALIPRRPAAKRLAWCDSLIDNIFINIIQFLTRRSFHVSLWMITRLYWVTWIISRLISCISTIAFYWSHSRLVFISF